MAFLACQKTWVRMFQQLSEFPCAKLTIFLLRIAASSTTMKAKKPTLKQVQAVRCPTCGAGPGEKCELSTGQPRTAPHRDRRLIAED
jgi:hypothetical protein